MILYRGVHESMFRDVIHALTPKERAPFRKEAAWDIAEWDTDTWHASDINAVIEHQHAQLGLATSGISTTPHEARARFYALGRAQTGCGYVISIDSSLCSKLGISTYDVNSMVRYPAVPEDCEVILVASNFGPLPEQVVIAVTKVCA